MRIGLGGRLGPRWVCDLGSEVGGWERCTEEDKCYEDYCSIWESSQCAKPPGLRSRISNSTL